MDPVLAKNHQNVRAWLRRESQASEVWKVQTFLLRKPGKMDSS